LIRIEADAAILRVSLNRPEKRNAIDERMIAELRAAIEKAAREAEVRAILITGEGPDFCAGMDLAMFAESVGTELGNGGALEFFESAQRLAGLYRALRDQPKPVVAAVKGRALGGGCGLAMACDAILAAESAIFGFPEVNIGFVPAIVMSLLRRSVGEKRAFDLLASGEPIRAHEARNIGMITRVYADSEFDASAAEYAAALAAKSASAMGLTKKLFYDIDGMSFDAALDAGTQVNAIARTTADARRGFEQFGKRKR
jgi:methylglutaconyl-CoA hydratase